MKKETLTEKEKTELKKWCEKNSTPSFEKNFLHRYNIDKNKLTMEEIIVTELLFKQKDFTIMLNSNNVFSFNEKPKIDKRARIQISGDITLENLKKLMIRCVKKYNKQKEK